MATSVVIKGLVNREQQAGIRPFHCIRLLVPRIVQRCGKVFHRRAA